MSASDHISLKRIRACNSVFFGKTAGNNTVRREVNAIVRAVSLDELGNAIPDNWFGVPIPNQPKCWTCAHLQGGAPAPPTVGYPSRNREVRAYVKARRYFVPRAEACLARRLCAL